jgi:hypothetical protein
MNTITIPAVEFKPQAVVPNFPNELHEAIVVTGELIEFARQAHPVVNQLMLDAKSAERFALSISRGEASWRGNNGPRKAIRADHLEHVCRQLTLLKNGKNSTAWDGWIDREEWNVIVKIIGTESRILAEQFNP